MVTKPALDPLEILRAIGIEDPNSVTPVTGGMDTAIWRVGHRENLYALRVFRPEQAPGIARETAAMIAAAAAGIPVPRLVQQGVWNDRPVLLLGWSPGQTVAHDVARTATILRLSPLPGGCLAPIVRIVLRVFEAGWIAGYRREAGALQGLAPFYAWAGRMMLRDRPGNAAQRRRIEEWIERWADRTYRH